MQGLEESLCEDQEMDEEPASSKAKITSLNEQTRLLKENLQKLEEQIVKTQVIMVPISKNTASIVLEMLFIEYFTIF